jgi:MFS family permease
VRFPALQLPDFRLYWVTSTVAMLGDNIEHVIGYWLLWELTHSPFWLGYAVFAHWFPFLLFSLHAGAWADRIDNRYLLQVNQACLVVCSGTLGVLAVTGHLQLWHMIILLLLHGFAGVIQTPSSQVLIYDLVGKDDLPNALSLAASSRYVAQFLGPMVGTWLLTTFGAGGGLVANLLCYVPLSVALLTLHPPRSFQPTAQTTGWHGIVEGLRFVRRHQAIFGLTLLAAIPGGLLGFGYLALMPALAEDLGSGQQGFGLLLFANGVGAIGGAVVLGFAGRVGSRGRAVCVATLAWAVLLALFAVLPWFWLAFGVLLLVGASSIVANALTQTLVQALSPNDLRGRIMGVYAAAVFGPRVISGLLLGGLATAVGAHPAVGILAGVIVVAVGALIAALPGLRTLD